MSVESENKHVVESFLKEFSGGDLVNAFGTYMTEDATWWVGGSIPGVSGTMDIPTLTGLLQNLLGGTVTGTLPMWPVAMTAEGDRVAAETESRTELKNGRVYANTYHHLFVLDGGKITHVKEYLDTEHVTATFLVP